MEIGDEELDGFGLEERFGLAEIGGGDEAAVDGPADDIADHFDHSGFIVDDQNAGFCVDRTVVLLNDWSH
jgi:hypothetical protein